MEHFILKTGQAPKPEPVFVFPQRPSTHWNLTPHQKSQHEKALGWICALTNPDFSLPRTMEAGK